MDRSLKANINVLASKYDRRVLSFVDDFAGQFSGTASSNVRSASRIDLIIPPTIKCSGLFMSPSLEKAIFAAKKA
jgi:hypothetical protein